MHSGLFRSLIVLLVTASTSSLPAQVGWRTDGTGVYPDANPPVSWSTDKNVVWATAMPGRSNSLPIIVGDRVLVCSEPFELFCLQLSDGKILWHRSNSYRDITSDQQWTAVEKELAAAAPLRARLVASNSRLENLRKQETSASDATPIKAEIEKVEQEVAKLEVELAALPLAARYTLPKTQEQFNGFTTATPTSDGKHVWTVFGNRVVVCYDMEGQLVWADVLPDNPQVMWGHASSPLLVGDKLIVNIEHTVAFDALTGRHVWRTKYGQSWGSPVRARIGEEYLILLASGRMIRASDGKVLKRVAGLADTSPVVQDGVAYYIDVRAEAHELPQTLSPGVDSIDLKTRWTIDLKGGTFFGSPIIHNGLIYAVSTQQVLNVIDAATGANVYLRRLSLGDQPVWPSLCLAGKYLYISGRDGTTLVLEPGREYKEVAKNHLEYFISTPVFHGNRMLVRTNSRLYCIGES